MGWPATGVSDSSGGLGLGVIEELILAEECGRALAGAPFLATSAAAARILALAGDPTGALAGIASGEIVPALAFAEGCEALPDRPAAKLRNGALFGEKTAVLGAAVADLGIVLATQEDGSLALVAVQIDDGGVTRNTLDTIDNSRCVATLGFEGAKAMILATDLAADLAREGLGRLALWLASEGVGGADRCVEMACAYANERQAFGQPIGKFQAVKHGIAEMYVLNELARASVLDAAIRLEGGAPDALAYVAAARLNAVHAYETAAGVATQIHGGIGVTWAADLHLHYRRSRSMALEAGAPAYWEDLIVEEVAGS